MDFEMIPAKRKIEIATNVLLLQKYGFDLNEFNLKDKQLYLNEESGIYKMFDDIYAELGYTINLENEMRISNIHGTSDLIELMISSKL